MVVQQAARPRIERVGRLTSASTRKLHRKVRDDPVLREEAVHQIRRSFPAFVRKHFELTPHEEEEMARIPTEIMDLLGRAFIASAVHGGDFRFETIEVSPQLLRADTSTGLTYKAEVTYSEKDGWKTTASVSYSK